MDYKILAIVEFMYFKLNILRIRSMNAIRFIITFESFNLSNIVVLTFYTCIADFLANTY